ncbi:unnamed protein product [Caenorhabditis bovis]|uniref:Uncharacterized protein n=1 Tax=Caenorhabditis bovis TaxID=2654633 RepID=A0A8S1ERZ9_9PELO|nr:unnamed protein product [Caenorhabditis bovis]
MWLRVLFYLLVFAGSATNASNIPCGKAFVPCENDILKQHELLNEDAEPFVSHRIPDGLLFVAAKEASYEIEKAFDFRDSAFQYSGHPLSTSTSQYTRIHKADKKASDRSRSAFTSLAMTKRLTALGLRERELRYGILPHKISSLISTCPIPTIDHCFATNYRSFSGICNNVAHPEWGASHTPLSRIVRPDYADGISDPRAARATNKPLPSVRGLSLTLFSPRGQEHTQVSTMLAHWMQIIGSDMVNVIPFQAVNEGFSSALPCCKRGFNHTECDPIEIPAADLTFRSRLSCIPHARSIIAPRESCKLGPREQGNFASAYLDASFIYGSSLEKTKQLRTFRNGQLRTAGSVGELPAIDSTLQCQAAHSRCALSGTDQVNILPGIAALHTVFIRHHNRLTDILRTMNRHWTDDKLFEEARKIVSAQIQHITYNEFLPILIGNENMKNYGLSLRSAGFDSNYEMSLEATVFNEFAVTIPYYFWALLPADRLFTDFNNPGRIYEQGPVPTIRHLLSSSILKPSLRVNDEIKNGFLKDNTEIGLDLISIALKQGRDHGIPGYTTIRTSCGLGRISSFSDLHDILLPEVKFEHLSAVYQRVEDIDLLIGVLAEKPLKGSLVGPTIACIIGKQMQRAKRADRFWYENYFAESGFTESQLMEIRNTKLAEIICSNIDIRRIQKNVFFKEDIFDNMPISCNSTVLAAPDFNEWRDSEGKPVFPIRQETIEKVIHLAKKNLKDQEKREISNIKHNQGHFNRGDPLFAYSNMMRAKKGAKQVSQISALLLETTKLLIKGEGLNEDEKLPNLDVPTLQKILPDIDVGSFVNNYTAFLSEDGQASVEECIPKMLPCDHTTRYRTFSGWCNNLKYPEYGNSFAPLRHILPPVYDDGFDVPRIRAKSGNNLPNPRRISNRVCEDKDVSHVKFTHMVMQFGQLLDHELTHSPVARGPNDEILNCTRCDSPEKISVHCMPIRVESDDPFFPTHYPNGEPRCLPFARSLLGQLNLGYRNQLNQLTAYVDGSAIYGSTKCEAKALRLFTRGLLNFTDFGHGQMMLPQGNQEKDCRSAKDRMPCFVAGDERNSHQPGLTVMHTFFLREHNRIAMHLSALNPHWNDDTVFEETRRILVAEMQHITFAEFLPKIVGLDLLNEQNLVPKKNGYFTGYDDTCDASISQPFATAAFRFGHTLIRRMFPRMNYNFKNMSEPVDLANHFGHVGPLYEKDKGGLDAMLMGLLGTPSMAFDRHITDAVRNHLFMRRGEKTSGMDLVVLNILRARDHGVQPYNDFREFCGLGRAKRFEDLKKEMDNDNINILQSLYESVDDIDLFPGLISERALKGALLGPTMSCIIAEQFGRLKRCDRFYYENDNSAAKFTPAQLNEIRKIKLASIFCSNSKYLKTIQPNVFDVTDDLTNAQVSCADIPQVDLSLWKERNNCELNGRTVALGDSVHMTPCVTCTCTKEGIACNPTKVDSCEKLTHKYLLTDISKDTSCMIQCTDYMKRV